MINLIKKINLKLLTVICFTSFASAQLKAVDNENIVQVDGIAAYVNDHVITVGDIINAMNPKVQQLLGAQLSGDIKARVEQEVKKARKRLIDKYLILDSVDNSRVNIPNWYVDKRVNDIIDASFGGNKAKLIELLKKDNQTFDSWRDEIKKQIIVNAAKSMNVNASIHVSPKEIKEYYQQNKDKFKIPEQVNIKMMIVSFDENDDSKKKAKSLAESIKKNLEKELNYEKVAEKYEGNSQVIDNGDLGWMSLADMKKCIADAVSRLKKNGDIAIASDKNNFYVVKLIAKKNPETQSFKELYPKIENAVRAEKYKEAYNDWIDRLSKNAYIKINPTTLF